MTYVHYAGPFAHVHLPLWFEAFTSVFVHFLSLLCVVGSVECLAFNSAQSTLYSCSSDRSVIVWDLSSSNLLTFELHGHE